MPIIKAQDAVDLSSQEASRERIESSAAAIVERARADATRLIAMAIEEARISSNTLREEARSEGYAAGRDKGFEQGLEEGRIKGELRMREQLDQLLASWERVLEEWAQCESSRQAILDRQSIGPEQHGASTPAMKTESDAA